MSLTRQFAAASSRTRRTRDVAVRGPFSGGPLGADGLTEAEYDLTVHAMVTAVVLGHLLCLLIYSPRWYA